jgi:hypothetical protein
MDEDIEAEKIRQLETHLFTRAARPLGTTTTSSYPPTVSASGDPISALRSSSDHGCVSEWWKTAETSENLSSLQSPVCG